MGWDSERSRREFAWLDLIARLKYDGYRGYFAGARFIESLLDWLQQFDEAEREAVYAFVRRRMVYFGPSELQHLVELFYPETVQQVLVDRLSSETGVPRYLVWSRPDLRAAYKKLLRQVLFMGISDGARLDTFRRSNEGVISNDQVVPTFEADFQRWESLVKDLRRDTGDVAACFRTIFLVDDFMGSGLTFLRKEEGEWQGKLVRCWKTIQPRIGQQLAPDFSLVVHHYLASDRAAETVPAQADRAKGDREGDWFPSVVFKFGNVLPPDLPVSAAKDADLLAIIDRHYNPSIMTKSMRVGGEDGRLGFNACGLPVILEHNAPNNALALLWAEAEEAGGKPEMRPLFRRRQRHL
jgi:hypothetical protein